MRALKTLFNYSTKDYGRFHSGENPLFFFFQKIFSDNREGVREFLLTLSTLSKGITSGK
jgi:hypothetical protein